MKHGIEWRLSLPPCFHYHGAAMNVVLLEPEIPPNTGNVARLCAAAKVSLHLVEPLGFRLNDRELLRAGMDYWQYVTWKKWDSLEELTAQAAPASSFYYLTKRTARPYTQASYRWGDYLVFGPETRGLPENLLAAHTDATIGIPMFHPRARSLNLATAVGIVLYEALRQVKRF